MEQLRNSCTVCIHFISIERGAACFIANNAMYGIIKPICCCFRQRKKVAKVGEKEQLVASFGPLWAFWSEFSLCSANWLFVLIWTKEHIRRFPLSSCLLKRCNLMEFSVFANSLLSLELCWLENGRNQSTLDECL